jgi:hypothetical protein
VVERWNWLVCRTHIELPVNQLGCAGRAGQAADRGVGERLGRPAVDLGHKVAAILQCWLSGQAALERLASQL